MPLSHLGTPFRPVALILWCAVSLALVLLLLTPGQAVPGEQTILRADKLIHAAALAVIIAAAAAFCRTVRGLAGVALLVVAGSGLMEFGQAFVPDRSPSLLDFAADLAGGAAGFALGALWIVARTRARRRGGRAGAATRGGRRDAAPAR